MSDRSLKKSLSGKTNRPVDFDADENLDLFSVNRTSLNLLLKPARRSFEQASDEKKHVNDSLCTIPEVPLGTISRSVLEARIVTFKLPSIATTKSASKSESDPSSKLTRSSSTIRASNIPTLRPSNIPTLRPSNIPTLGPSNNALTLPTGRSSSVPKKTTTSSASASVSAPKRTVSRSLTPVSRKITSPSLIPVSRKIPSRSPTPSKITSITPSFKNAGDAQRSRSLTPRSKPLIAATATSVTSSSKTKVRSVSASVPSRPSVSSTPPRTTALAFGKLGNVNSPKRNTSPDVTRTRPKGPSSSLIPTFSHTTASQKSVKSSSTVADSTRLVKKSSKASVQSATNTHLDVSRNRKMSTNPYSSTMLYPHSIRTSSSAPVLRKRYGSEGTSSSNQEEEEGKSLTKEEETGKKDSARYDALLDVKDVMDTNWLLNLDDQLNHSLIFEYTFDSPPEPFSPL